jgi:hypothetical protein
MKIGHQRFAGLKSPSLPSDMAVPSNTNWRAVFFGSGGVAWEFLPLAQLQVVSDAK